MSAKDEYKKFSTLWVLTAPKNPEQVEIDIKTPFVIKHELAKNWYREVWLEEPADPMPDPCIKEHEALLDDKRGSKLAVFKSQQAKNNAEAMVDGLKDGSIMLWQWGGIGYLLRGKWDEAPTHIKDYLRTRFADGVEI